MNLRCKLTLPKKSLFQIVIFWYCPDWCVLEFIKPSRSPWNYLRWITISKAIVWCFGWGTFNCLGAYCKVKLVMQSLKSRKKIKVMFDFNALCCFPGIYSTSWSLLACAPISKSNNFINKYMDGKILAPSFRTVCFADKCYQKNRVL